MSSPITSCDPRTESVLPPDDLPPFDDALDLPTAPGLGIDLDPSKVEDLREIEFED